MRSACRSWGSRRRGAFRRYGCECVGFGARGGRRICRRDDTRRGAVLRTLVRDLSHRRWRRPLREWRKERFVARSRRWPRRVPRCRVETKPCGCVGVSMCV